MIATRATTVAGAACWPFPASWPCSCPRCADLGGEQRWGGSRHYEDRPAWRGNGPGVPPDPRTYPPDRS